MNKTDFDGLGLVSGIDGLQKNKFIILQVITNKKGRSLPSPLMAAQGLQA